MSLAFIPGSLLAELAEAPPQPSSDRILDRDGLGWNRFSDLGWIPDGDVQPQPWAQIQKWGPFTPDVILD